MREDGGGSADRPSHLQRLRPRRRRRPSSRERKNVY